MSQFVEEPGSTRPEAASATTPASPPEAWTKELPRRLRLMFAAPGEAFRPPLSLWVWLAPLIVLSIWAFVQSYLCADLYMQAGLAANPNGAAALEQLPADKQGIVRISMSVGGALTMWVGVLIPAAVYWFCLNFIAGGKARFGAVLGVTAFTLLVLLPRDVLLTFLRLRAETIHVYTSPAAFVDPEQKTLIALGEHLDIFALYRLVLLGFGFRSISGLKGRQVGWLVGVLWVLGAGVAALMTLIAKSFMP